MPCETEEIAKAVQAVAKLGEKSLETSEKIGGFFGQVFKEPATEVAGMITDKLRFVRWKRLVEMTDEVNHILDQRGVEETRAVPPKLALPIFEESSLEEDPTLQSLWSNLLANAMDSTFGDEIRFAYTEIIKNLTSQDASLLRALYVTLEMRDRLDFQSASRFGITKEDICRSLGITEEAYVLSANNLMRLRVIAPFIILVKLGDGITAPGLENLTVDKGTDSVVLTPFGIRFVEACKETDRKSVV